MWTPKDGNDPVMIPSGEMVFAVETTTLSGACTPLTVYIRSPVIEPDRPGCWTCRFGWTGDNPREFCSCGATSLQALHLAIPLLQIRLDNAFSDGRILQDGMPFLLRADR